LASQWPQLQKPSWKCPVYAGPVERTKDKQEIQKRSNEDSSAWKHDPKHPERESADPKQSRCFQTWLLANEMEPGVDRLLGTQ